MEEILKKIEEEVKTIKEEQEKLVLIEKENDEARAKLEKAEKEAEAISDKESGFYKDVVKNTNELESQFRDINNKRMGKDRELNKLIAEKKDKILKEIADKKQYIDENRNVDLKGKDLGKLKEEKQKIEKELKLNETTREEFEKMTDTEKQEVRRAKENYLNNKHRLNEIEPTIKLMETLEGKEPKDKFMELDNLMKNVETKFNRNSFEEVLKGYEKTENREENKTTPKQMENETANVLKNEEQKENRTVLKAEEQKENKTVLKAEEQKENKAVKAAETIGEQVQNRTAIQKEDKVEKNTQNEGQKAINENQTIKTPQSNTYRPEKNKKIEIFLDVSKNEIIVDDEKVGFYKKALKAKKQLLKDDNLAIASRFINDKKSMKNIDYALLSVLNGKNPEVAIKYLDVIKNGKGSLKDLNEILNVKYRFDKDMGRLSDLKSKRIARYAHKLGIADLEGINEKGIFDRMKDIFSNKKLLAAKEEQKEHGEKIANSQKQKTISLINQDREKGGLREEIKVDNRGNRIEQEALKKQTEAENIVGNEVKEILEEQK